MKTRRTKSTFTTGEIEDLAPKADLKDSERRLALAAVSDSYTKIAADFGISLGTVKSRVSRVREKLAKARNLKEIA